MARYSSFLGHRVEVQYRASDTLLPASGVFVADSGRSIFLEQTFEQRGQHRYFRWEIPYQYLVKIAFSQATESGPDGQAAPTEGPAAAAKAGPQPQSSVAAEKLASRAAAGASLSAVVLPIIKLIA